MTEEVILYFGESPADREAVRIVVRAKVVRGVKCALVGPVSDAETPRLRVGDRDVFGPDRIRDEISRIESAPLVAQVPHAPISAPVPSR